MGENERRRKSMIKIGKEKRKERRKHKVREELVRNKGG